MFTLCLYYAMLRRTNFFLPLFRNLSCVVKVSVVCLLSSVSIWSNSGGSGSRPAGSGGNSSLWCHQRLFSQSDDDPVALRKHHTDVGDVQLFRFLTEHLVCSSTPGWGGPAGSDLQSRAADGGQRHAAVQEDHRPPAGPLWVNLNWPIYWTINVISGSGFVNLSLGLFVFQILQGEPPSQWVQVKRWWRVIRWRLPVTQRELRPLH